MRHKAANACICDEYIREINQWRVDTWQVATDIRSEVNAAGKVPPKRIPNIASALMT